MAYGINITSNELGGITIGSVEEQWMGGAMQGVAQAKESAPSTVLNLLTQTEAIIRKSINNHADSVTMDGVIGRLDVRNGGVDNINELYEAYQYLDKNTYWLWGSIDKGGFGIVGIGDPNTVYIISSNGVYRNMTTNKIGYYFGFSLGGIHRLQLSSVVFAYDINGGVHFGRMTTMTTSGGSIAVAPYHLMQLTETIPPTIPPVYIYDVVGEVYNYGYFPNTRKMFQIWDGQVLDLEWHLRIFGDNCEGLRDNDWCIFNDHIHEVQGYIHEAGTWSGGAEDNSPNKNNNGKDKHTGGNDDYIPSDDPHKKVEDGQFTKDAINSGLITIFNPTQGEIQNFCDFLFNGVTDNIATYLKRLRTDPLDYVISLAQVHYKPTTKNTAEIKFGGIGTGVVSWMVNKQVQKLDFGSVKITRQYNNFLDFSPYTKVKIYLPYIGFQDLEPVDILMNCDLKLVYYVDNLSGSCIAELSVEHDADKDMDTSVYDMCWTFEGNVFESLPLSATDYRSAIQGILTAVGGIGAMTSGNYLSGASAIASGVLSMKPNVATKESKGNTFGYLQSQYPFVEIQRPCMSIPDDYNRFVSYQTHRKKMVKYTYGHTKVAKGTYKPSDIDYITPDEEDELISLFEDGVIFPKNDEGWN